MAPALSAAEARLHIAEERIERTEQQTLHNSKELSSQQAYQKTLFRQLEKIEDGSRQQIEDLGKHLVESLGGKMDDVKAQTEKIQSVVESLASTAAAHDKRIQSLEDARKRRAKASEWGAGILAAILAAGVIGFVTILWEMR